MGKRYAGGLFKFWDVKGGKLGPKSCLLEGWAGVSGGSQGARALVL